MANKISTKLEVDTIQGLQVNELGSNSSPPLEMSLDDLGNQAIDRHLERISSELDAISNNPAVDLEVAVKSLELVLLKTKMNIERIKPKKPLKIPLWKQRGRALRNASIFEWVRDNFSNYGFGLTLNDIGKLDPTLHQAILKARSQGTVPKWFDLPTLEEANTRKIENMSHGEQMETARLGWIIRQRQKKGRL